MNKSRVKTARPVATLRKGRTDWYRIENKTGDAAEVYIYDEIGFWGVTADDFVKEFKDLNATEIHLHINSPGGEVFDGIAIYNAILNHRAAVTTYVDGLAASAASFIAMAGDTIKIARNAQMMIHDAAGLCIGNSQDMRDLADMLDRISDNIADIYSQRTGASKEDWRAAMRDETWYSAQEAVDAGLADEVLERQKREEEDDDSNMSNSWDLSVFRYEGRAQAPDPDIRSRTNEPVTPLALPEMKDPVPVPTTSVVEGEQPAGGNSFTLDPAIFRAALRQTTDPPTDDKGAPFAWDPETFRTLLKHSAEHAPAPPSELAQSKDPVTFGSVFDPEHLRHAVRDALTTARRKETE